MDDLVGRVRLEALRICGDRIANTKRHPLPGKMPVHDSDDARCVPCGLTVGNGYDGRCPKCGEPMT